MDEKLKNLRAEKEKAQEEKLISDADESKETFSGLLLRRGGRFIK